MSSPLIAEILEDSGQTMQGIDHDFTDRRVPDGPWPLRHDLDSARGALDGAAGREFRLAYGGGAAGALASFMHFRLREIGITAELSGVEADTFERTVLPRATTPAVIRLRRGADAPDAAAYAGEQVADALTTAETAGMDGIEGAGRLTGLDATGWTRVLDALAASATVIPMARVRTFLVGRQGVTGAHAVGASNGPMWNAGSWQLAG
jgi:hypothetical protein